ncbi:hypothetical protein MUK42_13863 [Musa troglodytarum]|uniref:Uncharacterized protein n=1 Tax=Musa troglodytarum TaxID=320322 RepID=A0A9E7L2F6_9LILI|nr:hypothetical protein MUK42_13863 [Musa troglodytarum]
MKYRKIIKGGIRWFHCAPKPDACVLEREGIGSAVVLMCLVKFSWSW